MEYTVLGLDSGDVVIIECSPRSINWLDSAFHTFRIGNDIIFTRNPHMCGLEKMMIAVMLDSITGKAKRNITLVGV